MIIAFIIHTPAGSDQIMSWNSKVQVEEGKNQDREISKLSLDDLIEFAKKNNPVYHSAQQDIKIAQADLITAGLFPNPQFTFSNVFIGGVPITEAGSPEYAPALNIDLDLSGKIGKRKEVAKIGIKIEELNFSDFNRLFLFQVRQHYWQWLLLSEQVKFRRDFFLNYMKLLRSSRVRAEKGDMSGIEFDRLELESIGYDAEYRAAELQLIEASQKMRRILGLNPSTEKLKLKGQLIFVPLKELNVFSKKASVPTRPDLASLIFRSVQAESLASLKRREVFPTFNLGTEYRFKGAESHWGVFFSFPIPIFNRNQGEISRAEQLKIKFQYESEFKKIEIRSEVQVRYRELILREKLLFNYQQLRLLEKNKKVAERSRFAYLKKAYSIVALVESQRNYINVQKNYYDQVYLYYSAINAYLTAVSDGNQECLETI
jgi:cobalt-zinc-cadmium efflux system outer membrane protein